MIPHLPMIRWHLRWIVLLLLFFCLFHCRTNSISDYSISKNNARTWRIKTFLRSTHQSIFHFLQVPPIQRQVSTWVLAEARKFLLRHLFPSSSRTFHDPQKWRPKPAWLFFHWQLYGLHFRLTTATFSPHLTIVLWRPLHLDRNKKENWSQAAVSVPLNFVINFTAETCTGTIVSGWQRYFAEWLKKIKNSFYQPVYFTAACRNPYLL